MKRWVLVLFGLLFLFCACDKNSVSGNSVETENTVALVAVDADGNALSNALFRIRPESFVVDTLAEECENCLDLQSDSFGKTELEELPEGSYIVEGIYKNLRGFVKMNAEEILDSLTLVPVGGISGQLALPENVKHGWVQLKGLDYLAKTDEDGYFQLDSLPVGDIQILAIIPGDTLATLSVAVRSKKVNKVGLLGKYKEPTKDSIPENDSIPTDTIPTDTIPEVQEDSVLYSVPVANLVSSWMKPLYDSTVVTLRLDESIFDFSKIATDAADVELRLSNAETILPYHVVRFDKSSSIGIFQVRVPASAVENDTLEIVQGEGNIVSDIWEGIPDSVRLKLSSVSFGGFESGNMDVGFPEPLESREWYVVSSEKANMYTSIDSADLPRGGSAFRFSYSSVDDSWVLIGAPLNEHCNFAAFDSVAIWAKGNGILSFALEKLDVEKEGKAWTKADLTMEWKRYVFTKEDFLPASDTVGQNTGWEDVRDSVSNIAIFGYDGADLWVDDIVLYGVSRDDLK